MTPENQLVHRVDLLKEISQRAQKAGALAVNPDLIKDIETPKTHRGIKNAAYYVVPSKKSSPAQTLSEEKITWADVLVNPRAAVRSLSARAEIAEAKARVRKEISDTRVSRAEVSGLDTRRGISLLHNDVLEKQLGHLLPQYCYERDENVPPLGSSRRRILLNEMNAQLAAEQKLGKALVVAVERAVAEKVRIKGEAARDQVKADELPFANEAARLAHQAEEIRVWEELRTFFTKIGGGSVAIVSGLLGGVTNAISEGVKNMPLITVPLGAVGYYIVRNAVTLAESSFSLSSVTKGTILITAATVLGAGIGSGLVSSFTEGKKKSSTNLVSNAGARN